MIYYKIIYWGLKNNKVGREFALYMADSGSFSGPLNPDAQQE